MVWTLSDLTSTSTTNLSVQICSFVAPYSSYFTYTDTYGVFSFLNSLNFTFCNVSFLSNYESPLYFSIVQHSYLLNYSFNLLSIFFVLLAGVQYLNLFNTNFSRLEKELNSLEDLFIVILLLLFFIFFIFSAYVYFYINAQIFTLTFITLFYLVSVIIIILPILMLLEYGYYYVFFLRGSSSTLIFTYEILLDYINIISFFLRIFIQFVRIILVLLTISTYNELFLELTNCLFLNNLSNSSELFLSTYIAILIHFIFEYTHVLIIFIAQFLTFILMLLWLFQFLFTMFISEKLESFFLKNFLNKNEL